MVNTKSGDCHDFNKDQFVKLNFSETQRKILTELVESKFGKYTRDIQDLELVEEELTDYEKRKYEEEKRRLESQR